jgi:hypothetical protein
MARISEALGSPIAEKSISDEPESHIEVRNRLVVERVGKTPMRDGYHLRWDILRPQGEGEGEDLMRFGGG